MGAWFDEQRPQSNEDVLRSFDMRETPLSEYLGAKLSEGFDYTTTRVLSDEFRVAGAEEKAYGKDPRPAVDPNEMVFADTEGQERLTKTDRPIQTKEEWAKSESFRPGIKYEKVGEMTPVRAQILADDYDNRRYRDSLLERSPTGMRSILGFGAGMIGSLPDPVNVVSFGAVGAGRTFARAAVIGAAENVAASALVDAVVLPDLAARGEDVGFKEFAMDSMFAAAIGSLFGVGGQALKNATESARMRTHVPDRQVLANSLEKAAVDVADGRPADVRDVLKLEKESLGRLYDEALLHPMGGDSKDASVRLTRETFADDVDRAISSVLVEKGSGKARPDGSITFDAGYGLVKIIWKHGEESSRVPGMQVRKEDILAFPGIIKEYEPTFDKRHGGVDWVVQREDGRQVVYGVREYAEDGVAHLVTVHVPDPGKEKATLSSRLKTGETSGSSSALSRLIQDTTDGASPLTRTGAESLDAQAGKNITTVEVPVKAKTAPAPLDLADSDIKLLDAWRRDEIKHLNANPVKDPVYDFVRGRIDASSVTSEERKTLNSKYGQSIWAKKGTGVALDVLETEIELSPEFATLRSDFGGDNLYSHLTDNAKSNKSHREEAIRAIDQEYYRLEQEIRDYYREEAARESRALAGENEAPNGPQEAAPGSDPVGRGTEGQSAAVDDGPDDWERAFGPSTEPNARWGDPHPEVFTDPAEIIRRESTPDVTEQAMAAHIDALEADGKLLEIDHRELSDARETTSRAEQYGEHLLNIAECAAKVVS